MKLLSGARLAVAIALALGSGAAALGGCLSFTADGRLRADRPAHPAVAADVDHAVERFAGARAV